MSAGDVETTSVGGLRTQDWKALLGAIEKDNCTPFLGAGACSGRLPSASRLAFDLATETEYPLPDCDDLARVSQFAAVELGPKVAKCMVLDILNRWRSEQGNKSLDYAEPHSVLARLPLKLYITTNYDDLMFKALQQEGRKAYRDHCRWYESAKSNGEQDRPTWEPLSVKKPLVFHLHGCDSPPDSMVLTEDDYVDFLVKLGEDLSVVPPVIQEAISKPSLLFIGYGLRDLNFRVLHRALLSKVLRSQQSPSFTVQLAPFEFQPGVVATVHMKNGDRITGTVIAGEPHCYTVKTQVIGRLEIDREDVRYIQVVDPGDQPLAAIEHVKSYLSDYYRPMNIRVFWGTAHEFARELWRRWVARNEVPLPPARPAEGVASP